MTVAQWFKQGANAEKTANSCLQTSLLNLQQLSSTNYNILFTVSQ
jgi:hypothetical protein